MNNIYRFDRERKEDDQHVLEASEWIARMDKGLANADAEALLAWMRADSRNEEQLLKMARVWDKMDALARLSELFPHPSGTGAVSVRRMSRLSAIAASFIVVISGFVMTAAIMNPGNEAPSPTLASAVAAYETAIGGISTIELPDGSLLTLNTNTRVVVSFDEMRRIVQLKRGEMHIDVAHDPTRPLSVVAAGRIVQAVGTAFSVNIDAARRVEVLVDDGRVQVGVLEQGASEAGQGVTLGSIEGQSLLIAQGERVLLNAGDEDVEALEPEEVEVQLSWLNGNLIFRGESLETAVAEVGRYTAVEFVITDEALEQVRVAGLFKAGDVAGFLSTLEANFDIVYQRADDETILLSAEQSPSKNVPK